MGKEIKINHRGGLVTAPILYLKNTLGMEESSIELKKRVKIESVGKALCEHFDNHSNCTLVGVHNLLSFYRDVKGYTDIPADAKDLYSVVRTVADRYGYKYKKEKGIPVYNNRRFLKAVLKKLSYNQERVRAEYMVPARRALKLLDEGTPFLLSIAYGVYFNHTITVYGYETYRDIINGHTYTFLIINDEWSAEVRYLPWSNLDKFRVTCLTKIK